MDKTIQKITEILSTLRSDSISYQNNPHDLMDKYNLMFLGNNFNLIYTNDLLSTLNDYFHINISEDQLHKSIPKACEILSMNYEPMKNLNDLNNPVPYAYQITLW